MREGKIHLRRRQAEGGHSRVGRGGRPQDWLTYCTPSWLGGSVVERRSLTGELSLVCTGPATDG